MQDFKAIVGMVCIAITLSIALFMGHDGLMLTSAVALIAGIAGFTLGRVRKL